MDPNLNDLIWFAVGSGSFILLLVVIAWHRRRSRGIDHALEEAALESLRDLVVTNADEGPVHINRVLLMPDAILVVEYREDGGNVFAADGMREWTIISERSRYTFQNPQTALYDRVAALRRVVPDVTVSGLILFGQQASFPKGKPGDVLLLEEFLTRYPPGAGIEAGPALSEAWERIRSLQFSQTD